jgi:acyl carrier protein
MDNLKDKETVFLQLKAMISQVIGADVVEIIGVREDSSFIKDLEMSSIQIVEFAGMVQERYGDRVDFVAWLSKKSVLKLTRLTVGDVVKRIGAGR